MVQEPVVREPAVHERTLSSEDSAEYAEELRHRWQSSFHKSRPGAIGAGKTVAVPQGQFEPGQTINGLYRIDAPLSKGGMGCVYRATHLQKDMPVVLKVLLQDREPDDPAFQKFVQECKLTMTIAHPNVVTVYDWGILSDTLSPYLIMEYLNGQSLRDALCCMKRLPVGEAAPVLAQACDGLDYVHKEDVLHRDLKPENLMVQLEDDGTAAGKTAVKILDFGIAQLHDGIDFTDGGNALGTLSYMSPEQVQTKPLDLRCDIYAMGAVFYELITGQVPFKGQNAWETMKMHVFDSHVPPSQLVQLRFPEAVDALIDQCLAKDPGQRYSSARALADDLRMLAEAEMS